MCRIEPDGARAIVRLHWGLAPSWARDARTSSHLINVHAESDHYKPSFRTAFRLRRCLLPVNGWFEWQSRGHGKKSYFLTLKDGSPLSFAALWERWDPRRRRRAHRDLRHHYHGGLFRSRRHPSSPAGDHRPPLVHTVARPDNASADAARAGAEAP